MNKFGRKMITKAHWSKCTTFWGRRWQIKNENAHTKVSNYMIKCRRNIQVEKWKFNMAGLLREITWPARAARDLRASGNFVKSQNKAGKIKNDKISRTLMFAAELRLKGEKWGRQGQLTSSQAHPRARHRIWWRDGRIWWPLSWRRGDLLLGACEGSAAGRGVN